MATAYYAIVTFGAPSYGRERSYYRSLERAIADALTVGGGTCTTVRVVRAPTRAEAIAAAVSSRLPVEWQS